MQIERVHARYLLALVIASLIPLMMRYHGGTDYLALSLSGILLTTIAWLIPYRHHRSRDQIAIPQLGSPLAPFLLFFVWSSISILWSIDQTVSWIGVSWLFFFINGYLIATYLSKKSWTTLLRLIVAIGVLIAILTLYQSYIEHPVGGSVGLLRNPNTNASFLFVSIILFTGFSLSSKKLTFVEFGVLAALSLALSSIASRGALVVLIASFILFFLAVRTRKKRHKKFILVTSIVAVFMLIDPDIFARGLNTILHASGTFARLELWKSTWQIFMDNPYLGTGFATFSTIYPGYRNPLELSDGGYAHSDYLQYLAELGPVGFLLFAWFVLLLLWRFPWRSLNYISFPKLGVWMALAGILVHSLVTFHLYQIVMLFLVGLFVGHLSKNEVTSKTQFNYLKGVITDKLVLQSFALVSILMVSIYTTFWVSNFFIDRSHKSADQISKLQELEQASLWAPYYSQPKILIARELLKRYIEIPADKGEQLYSLLMEQLDTIESSSRCASFLMRAQALIKRDAADKRIATNLEGAVRCNPYKLIPRLTLYDYLMKRGERARAHSLIEAVVGIQIRTVPRTFVLFLKRLAAARKGTGLNNYTDAEQFIKYLQSNYRVDDQTIHAFTYRDRAIEE